MTSLIDSHQDRMAVIFNELRKNRIAKVSDLQQLLGVSDMTVRRCLNIMAAEGLVKRVRGGAMAIEGNETKFMLDRNELNAEIKAQLAIHTMRFIPENASIYLDSGTTCLAVAKRLADSGKRCNVVTDSIKVLFELKGAKNVNAMLFGGSLCDDMTTVDGSFTADAAERMSMDVCMFSSDSFNNEQMDQKYLAGVMTKKILLRRSQRRICICDSSKYNRRCCFRFCGWEDVDVLITDTGLPEVGRRVIADKGVAIELVELTANDNDTKSLRRKTY